MIYGIHAEVDPRSGDVNVKILVLSFTDIKLPGVA